MLALVAVLFAAGLSLADVASIKIDTSVVGDLGVSTYSETIGHAEGAFVRTDASLVRNDAVAQLVNALNRPPSAAIPFERMGFTRASLRERLDDADAYIGAAVSIPSARTAFESLFLDNVAMENWLVRSERHCTRFKENPAACFRIGAGDFAPSLNATIALRHGKTIKIASASQDPFMLPFSITDASGTHVSSDPGLARAIAGLMPKDALLSGQLAATGVPLEWAYALSQTKAVALAIEREAISPATARDIADRRGLLLTYTVTPNPKQWPAADDDHIVGNMANGPAALQSAAAWSGFATQKNQPRARFMMGGVRSSATAFETLLLPAHDAFAALHAATWLSRGLTANPSLTVELSPDTPETASYVTTLREHGRSTIAQILAASRHSALLLTLADGAGHSSRWFLLPDGSTILLDFQDGISFPNGVEWYRSLPKLRPDGYSGNVGIMLNPDGNEQ